MRKASPFLKKLVLGIAWAVWTCCVLILVQFLLSLFLSWLFGIIPFYISSTIAQTVFTILSYGIGIAIVFFVPSKLIKKIPPVTKSELGLNELPTWTDIGLAPVGFIVYILLASVLTSFFSAFPWFDATQAQNVGFNVLLSPVDRIFAFISLVIIAPITEEIIFRGFLYQKIKSLFFHKATDSTTKRKRKRKSELLAITVATLITSTAFGLIHRQWNVGINVFAMSIVLCLMREITGSIYSGIILHLLKNIIAFYLLYIATFSF